MTRKPSNIHSHENTSDKARHGRKGLTPARRMRRIIAAALVPAAAAVTLLSSAGIAGAATTPLSSPPTSECYGNGTVTADKPTVNSNGQLVYFTPMLDVWSNGQWVLVAVGQIQHGYEPYMGSFGSWLYVTPIEFHALPNHYYAVVDVISAGGSSWDDYTSPMVGRASSYYCYTG